MASAKSLEPAARLRGHNHFDFNYRKDTPLYQHEIARQIHMERQREIEMRLAHRVRRQPARRSFSVRRHVGRGLIQLGSVLAADGPLQPAARG